MHLHLPEADFGKLRIWRPKEVYTGMLDYLNYLEYLDFTDYVNYLDYLDHLDYLDNLDLFEHSLVSCLLCFDLCLSEINALG